MESGRGSSGRHFLTRALDRRSKCARVERNVSSDSRLHSLSMGVGKSEGKPIIIWKSENPRLDVLRGLTKVSCLWSTLASRRPG